ncbi:hypothetical protein SAMD00019534_051620 [Acytostelium subglobosum LB1]|uniref:hypothetical protein n=1 Tax=Acytostelium subglobosum LB1 TaxID=1410327 RepID=UPI000644D204|nr:hypothetical protein SAMD00019534_051620 [Acytostelium subglobosum LB1]GAM21987.1 hypothetical protein SAMD00019534_051620 [Acytostelium subglobosum LB1]|eukprot:XP_012755087.1 hypothetical protein SAMD00019534_051620 [Acytostelium subglobosum LB1]
MDEMENNTTMNIDRNQNHNNHHNNLRFANTPSTPDHTGSILAPFQIPKQNSKYTLPTAILHSHSQSHPNLNAHNNTNNNINSKYPPGKKSSSLEGVSLPFNNNNHVNGFHTSGPFRSISTSSSPMTSPSPSPTSMPTLRNTPPSGSATVQWPWDVTKYFETINMVIDDMETKLNKETPSRNIIDYKIFKTLISSLRNQVASTQINLQTLLHDREMEIEDMMSELSKLRSMIHFSKDDKLKISSLVSSNKSPNNSYYAGNASKAPLSLLDDDDGELNISDDDSDGEQSLHPRKMLKKDHNGASTSQQHFTNKPRIISHHSLPNINSINSINGNNAPVQKPPKEEWATEVLLNLNTSSNGTSANAAQHALITGLLQNSNHSSPNNSPPHELQDQQGKTTPPNGQSATAKPQLPPTTTKFNFVPHDLSGMNPVANANANPNANASAAAAASAMVTQYQASDFQSSSDNEDDKSNDNGGTGGSSGKNKKKRGKLPCEATSILKKWLFEHNMHPYPTEDEKAVLASSTTLSFSQINNWFTNARRRILPRQLDRKVYGSPLFSHFSMVNK